MTCIRHIETPFGAMTMAGEEDSLTGLWFDDQKYFALTLPKDTAEESIPVFDETERWLEMYFKGVKPDFLPKLAPKGSAFRQEVWRMLLEIPYGQTVTYGSIAKRMAAAHGIKTMSAQAVGGAVGHNPISLIIPCHRVVGTNGSLTGYAGGIERKHRLLQLEHAAIR